MTAAAVKSADPKTRIKVPLRPSDGRLSENKKRKLSSVKESPKIDGDVLELILKELDGIVNIIKSAQYPVHLDSAWLCVVSLEPIRAFVIPLAEGACDTKIVRARETEAYKQYKKLFVKETEGQGQMTAEALLKLKSRGFKTPLAALPHFLAESVDANKIAGYIAGAFSKIWGKWLAKASWADMEGPRCEIHSVDAVGRKSFPSDLKTLDFHLPHSIHPYHPLFVPSVRLEIDDLSIREALRNSIVKVWSKNSHKQQRRNLLTCIHTAYDSSLLCALSRKEAEDAPGGNV